MASPVFDNKQNECKYICEPRHQGRAFKLEVGQNNGPFLSKDVMHSNQKSTYLLAAKNILQAHMSMSNMMGILSKEEESQAHFIKNSSTVASWFSKCEFLQGQLSYIEKQSKKLAIEEKKLKSQIKSSYERLLCQNEELASCFAPLFKNLLKTIREQSNDEKNIFEEHKRNLQQLTKFRNLYLDELVYCERRIIRTQQFLGITESANND